MRLSRFGAQFLPVLEPGARYHIQVVKTRLNPGVQASGLLLNYTTAVNAVYNQVLYRAKNDYQTQQAGTAEGEPIPVFSAYALDTHLAAVKHDWFSWDDQVPAAVFTDAARRLSDAYTRMAKKKAAYPRFRKKRSELDAGKQSVTFKKKPSDRWLADDGRHITLPVAAARREALGMAGNQPLWIPLTRDRRVWRVREVDTSGPGPNSEGHLLILGRLLVGSPLPTG